MSARRVVAMAAIIGTAHGGRQANIDTEERYHVVSGELIVTERQ
jgi:uncharacterized cupin superfamily protein